MIKNILAGVVAMSFVSFGAHAAQGQGVVNFKGTVIDAPCGIAPESADQSIDFGQISKSHLEASGISVKKNLDIKLVNCNFTQDKLKTVNVIFSGANVQGHVNELGTSGQTGTAIVISTQDGKLVSFDGTTAANTEKLKNGDNTLHYSTWVQKASDGQLAEGSFTAVTNFNLIYQ